MNLHEQNTRSTHRFHKAGIGLFLLISIAVLLSACGGGPVSPLTVVAQGALTSFALDKLDEKATHIIGQAAGAAGLVTAKAARDLQLLVSAARQEFHDELNSNWDRLDSQKVSILREIDTSLDRLDKSIQAGGRMEDTVALDISGFLERLPFSKSVPTVRRIEGATQYFRETGFYRLVLTGNTFSPFQKGAAISIGGKVVDPAWLNSQPPYGLAVTIPAAYLQDSFKDRTLSYIPVSLTTEVPNRSSGLFFWRNATRAATFDFKLELFPKFAVAYRLTEWRKEKVVDSEHVLIQPGPITVIPGCGNSGCNAYYTVCTDVPAGTEPIEIPVSSYYDSFQGWGGFGNPRRSATGMCATYWQHSHNVTRNVKFDVSYHPLKDVTTPYDVKLEPLTIGTARNRRPSVQFMTVQFNPLEQFMKAQKAAQAVIDAHLKELDTAAQKVIANAVTVAGTSTQLIGGEGGYLRIGRAYSARFSSQMQSYDLVLRSFSGEEFPITPGTAPPGPYKVSAIEDKTDFKRFTIQMQLPW